jgi:uncharacterized protein YqgV (UPF0045/DUF77 family)
VNISAELTLYPLSADYRDAVNRFLERLLARTDLQTCVGSMSTVVVGDYDVVMQVLQEDCRQVFAAGAAAFVIKLSNACPV